jgi:hypothetical protein
VHFTVVNGYPDVACIRTGERPLFIFSIIPLRMAGIKRASIDPPTMQLLEYQLSTPVQLYFLFSSNGKVNFLPFICT